MAGFRPLRHLNGSKTFVTQQFKASTSAAAFIGDMCFASAAVVKPYNSTNAAASAASWGVIARCYDGNGKPWTHSAPARGPYKPAATSGFVDVYIDPDIVYEIECDTSASAGTTIGAVFQVTALAGNTATGQSKQEIKAQTSATLGQVRLISVTPLSLSGTSVNYEVVSVRSIFRASGA